MFTREFGRRFTVGHSLSAEEAAARWALVSHNGGHRIPHRLSVYLDERVCYGRRWHGAVRDWPKPLGFVWGLQDPVATTNVLAGLRELNPEPRRRASRVGPLPPDRRPGRLYRGRAAAAHPIAGQLKKLVTAVASSGDADVARFW